MKKVILPIVALMLSMVACQKDNEGILKLEVEQYNNDAKLHLDDNYAVWDDEDPVKVNGTDYTVNVSSNSATITGVPEAANYTAIYPADWANTTGTTLTYPETQTYRTNGTAQVIDAPMAAYSDGGTLKFHNLGSILAVNVSGMSRVETIKVVADVNINGTCTISDITTNAPTLGTPTSGTNTTILECNGVTVADNETKTFYIALPPVEAKLTIIVDDGSIRYTRSQNSAMTFASNHGYNVPFSASSATADQYAPTRKQIWYKTNNSSPIENFGSSIGTPVSNEWNSTLGYYVATYSSVITSIPDECFKWKTSLTDIILPEGITTIGEEAFYQCGSLSNVVLPYSLTYIDNYVFWYTHSLLSLEIPNPDIKMVKNIFYESGLQNLILHSNNVFINDDIDRWGASTAGEGFQEWYNRASGRTKAQKIENTWEELYTNEFLWSLNTDRSTPVINVYVPDVSECTSISFDWGVISCLGSTNYFYKPWQRLVEMSKIQLLPLSSL